MHMFLKYLVELQKQILVLNAAEAYINCYNKIYLLLFYLILKSLALFAIASVFCNAL